MTTLITASVLAFERNLDISDAFLWQRNSETPEAQAAPILVREKSVRGTISNRLKNAISSDPTKLDAEIQKPNLQTIDVATLNAENNILQVTWSCKVLPFNGQPSVCNSLDYKDKLLQVVGHYIANQGLSTLATRYATNMVNARWLWRNRLGAESIKVTVRCQSEGQPKTLVFDDTRTLLLNDFDTSDGNGEALEELSKVVENGLTGQRALMIYITAEANVGFGQEVYPSQELILDTGKSKSKVLYVNNEEDKQAGIHSQKIGNAIRTIDTWYSENAEIPIAVEPYGSVTTLGHAFRQPKDKLDFYTLFDNWIIRDEEPSVEQKHYVMAVLLRGGVFGQSGKE